MLLNGSFENGWWDRTAKQQIPNEWDWMEYGPDTPNPIDPAEHSRFQAPEVRVLPRHQLPDNEQNLFILDGDHTLKIFAGSGTWWAGPWQNLAIDPGDYKFTVNVFGDLVKSYDGGKQWADDPLQRDGQFRFVINNGLGVWRPIMPGQWNEYSVVASNPTSVGIEIMCPFPLANSGVFCDNWTLERLSDPSPSLYARTIHFLPQDTTPAELQQVVDVAYPLRQGITFSIHDAFAWNPLMTKNNAIVWAPKRHGGMKAVREWVRDNCPTWKRNNVTGRPFGSSANWDQYLLWQRDPRWSSKPFGSATYQTTLGAEGCYLTNVAMSQRLLGVDANATPATVVDALSPSDYGSGTAEVKWSSIEGKLSVAIRDGATTNVQAQSHVKTTGPLMAEVRLAGRRHFVLAVEYKDGDWTILDPWTNQVGKLSVAYGSTFRGWRRLSRATAPVPPPPPTPRPSGEFLSIHVQDGTRGWLDFLRCEPRWIKLVNGFERAEEIKQRSPNTKVLVRFHTGTEPPTIDYAALDRNADWIDAVENENETIASGDVFGIEAAVARAVTFSNEIKQRYGDAIKACLLNVAIGNPGHDEVFLLLPAFEAAVRNKHYIGYHPYFPCARGVSRTWMETEKLHHHMRDLLSWYPVAAANGLHPKFLATECGAIGAHVREDGRPGAYVSAASGFRAPECLNGDWNLYLELLLRWREMREQWNAVHGWRSDGGMIFTIGGPNWDNFNLYNEHLSALAEALRA